MYWSCIYMMIISWKSLNSTVEPKFEDAKIWKLYINIVYLYIWLFESNRVQYSNAQVSKQSWELYITISIFDRITKKPSFAKIILVNENCFQIHLLPKIFWQNEWLRNSIKHLHFRVWMKFWILVIHIAWRWLK